MFWLVFQTKVSIKRQLGSALIEHWMNLFIWVYLVNHVDHLLNVVLAECVLLKVK